jgi:hypothetical protein
MVPPSASIIRAPAGTVHAAAAPAQAMRSPRITTTPSSTGAAPVPSISRPRSTVAGSAAASTVRAACAAHPPSASIASSIALLIVRISLIRVVGSRRSREEGCGAIIRG